jgi:nucleoside-diphosphate-sugar epimerase
MRVLVTGGSSFVGAPLVRALEAGGYDVRLLTGDIRDPVNVSQTAAGCDSVIHLAYARADASDRDILDTAVLGITAVLDACERHHIRDLMLVSSPLADVAGNRYGTGKLVSEQMAEAWLRDKVFQRVVIARVFNAYGPDMGSYHVIPQFARQMIRLDRDSPAGEVIRFPVRGSGQDVRSFVYIDDCTEQLLTLFRHGSPGCSRYDAGSYDQFTTGELATLIGEHFGREIRAVPSDPDSVRTVRIPKIPALLSPALRTDFGDGLAWTLDWYRKQEVVSG